MKKLIRLDEFIFDCHEKCISNNGRTYNYAKFLNQPLKLEMFVPCDEYDNVLDKPFECSCAGCVEDCIGCEFTDINYQQAKEKVLFEGFKYIKELRNSGGNYTHILKKDNLEIYLQWGGFHISGKKEIKTVEDLIPYNLTLTKNAIDKHEL